MSFILPDLTALVVVMGVVAAAGGILLLGVLAQTLLTSRRDRVARHESIPTYYGRRIAFSH